MWGLNTWPQDQDSHTLLAELARCPSGYYLCTFSCSQKFISISCPFPTKGVDDKGLFSFMKRKKQGYLSRAHSMQSFCGLINISNHQSTAGVWTASVCLSPCLAQNQLSEGLLNWGIKSVIVDQIEVNSFLKSTSLSVSKDSKDRLLGHVNVILVT